MTPSSREEIRTAVKEIVTSIKPLDDGLEDIPNDAPLFDDGSGEPSPVDLDSLDALDLALAVGERFNLDGPQLDRLLSGDLDLQSLRTVNDIVDFILSASPRPASRGSETAS